MGSQQMEQTEQIVERYFAVWNEEDAVRRRELIVTTWTEDATYVDPLMRGDGHAGIDAMVGGVQAQFPGFRFRRTGEVDAFADRVRFGWELGPAEGTAVAGGVDFGEIAGDRLRSVTGFLEFAPGAPGQ